MFNRRSRPYRLFLVVLLGATLTGLTGAYAAAAPADDNITKIGKFLETIKDKPPLLRMFMQKMPKGGDLHNHLSGAIYAETYLEWATKDGLCVDLSIPAILKLGATCSGISRMQASEAIRDPEDDKRRRLIDGLSMRSFVPTPGWSGHDQFFVTFDRMENTKKRFPGMLAEVARRAGNQNLGYLELMVTKNVGKIMGYLAAVKKANSKLDEIDRSKSSDWNANFTKLLKALKAGADGKDLGDQVKPYLRRLYEADQKRFKRLGCDVEKKDAKPPSLTGYVGKPGCEVVLRFLYQNIRKFEPEVVFTQFFFSWLVYRERNVDLGGEIGTVKNPVVGMNLVTPEDWLVATRDYRLHMEMLDYLWKKADKAGDPQPNIALHAGELTLGNVRPDELKYRIKMAIDLGHAKRIGHGVAIAYETDSLKTLARMAKDTADLRPILIEINLTSNAKILKVSGRDHPMRLYHKMGVPIALSSDDDAVLRSDLTRDYVLAVLDQGFGYVDLKKFSENSLDYSFLDQATRLTLRNELDARFGKFEDWVKNMADKICGPTWWKKPISASC